MNRNTNLHFSMAPQVDIQRSTFDRGFRHILSGDIGQCLPFALFEVLPGDTYKVRTSKIVRMQTLKTPIMDDVYADYYWFFVPNRLCWSHWKNFMGENTASAWIPSAEYSIPQITSPSGGWNVGTIADYLGIPPKVGNLSVNALPFRAYALIMSEFFRDENLTDPLVVELGDSTVSGSNGTSYVTDVAKGSYPFLAAKSHDAFTSALPAPLKGPDVTLSLLGGTVSPVYTVPGVNSHYDFESSSDYTKAVKAAYPLAMDGFYATHKNVSGYGSVPFPITLAADEPTHSTSSTGKTYSNLYNSGSSDFNTMSFAEYSSSSVPKLYGYEKIGDSYSSLSGSYSAVTPVNLVAENSLAYTSINELRLAFQIQRYYERLARGGSRYIEVIESQFKVKSPDARLQRPEYLGGSRIGLNIRQITQTSSTTESSPMGDVAGMSVTADSHYDFEKSFTEHGYILGIMVARYDHTYQQGIERTFLRKHVFDFYTPALAHIGEVGIKNAELYAQGYDSTDPSAVDYDSQIFGYQEAWYDYRYKVNRVSSMMRSVANSGMDSWHFADNYDSLPYLSDAWIREDKTNVDRTLTVTSEVANQLFMDIRVDAKATRPMPLYSIPGLIDHF